MSTQKASLLANQNEILAALPKELHENFLKEVEAMNDHAPEAPSHEATVEAIKAELVANPAVDEHAAADHLKEIKAPEAMAKPTEAESAAEMAAMLKEVQAGN